MIKRFARGVLTLAVVAVTSTTGAVAAQAAATPKLTLGALAFAQAEVDATNEPAAVDLHWTIKDSGADAEYVSGEVTIRMRSTVTGALLGHGYTLQYSYGDSCCSAVRYTGGTPQESSYEYTFVAPSYSDAAGTYWEVVQVTARDDKERAATFGPAKLQTYGYRLTAATKVDSTGPTAEQFTLDGNPYLYLPGSNSYASFAFDVNDSQSGFWKGTLKLAGPGGQSITSPFQWEQDPWSTGTRCGRSSGGDGNGNSMPCTVDVALPVDAAPGNWRVAQVVVINNVGGRTTYKSPSVPSVIATSNDVLSASGIVNDPQVLDNWRADATGRITMTVTGLRKGLSSVTADFDMFSCSAGSAALNGNTLTIPVQMRQNVPKCVLTGLAIRDGAGTLALYGTDYGAPDPKITFTRVPSTSPPTVLGATVDPTTMTTSESAGRWLNLTIRTEVKTAPISQMDAYLYDSAGRVVSQVLAGASQAADGTIKTSSLSIGWSGLAPGEYTVGFTLSDAGGLQSHWSEPDMATSTPIPGGGLTLTVTEG